MIYVYLLLTLFGAANTTTKEWEKSTYDYTPIFHTMLYQIVGILSFIVAIIALIVACTQEWWYPIGMVIPSIITNRIMLPIFNSLGIRHIINLLSLVAIPILAIILLCSIF